MHTPPWEATNSSIGTTAADAGTTCCSVSEATQPRQPVDLRIKCQLLVERAERIRVGQPKIDRQLHIRRQPVLAVSYVGTSGDRRDLNRDSVIDLRDARIQQSLR